MNNISNSKFNTFFICITIIFVTLFINFYSESKVNYHKVEYSTLYIIHSNIYDDSMTKYNWEGPNGISFYGEAEDLCKHFNVKYNEKFLLKDAFNAVGNDGWELIYYHVDTDYTKIATITTTISIFKRIQ